MFSHSAHNCLISTPSCEVAEVSIWGISFCFYYLSLPQVCGGAGWFCIV